MGNDCTYCGTPACGTLLRCSGHKLTQIYPIAEETTISDIIRTFGYHI